MEKEMMVVTRTINGAKRKWFLGRLDSMQIAYTQSIGVRGFVIAVEVSGFKKAHDVLFAKFAESYLAVDDLNNDSPIFVAWIEENAKHEEVAQEPIVVKEAPPATGDDEWADDVEDSTFEKLVYTDMDIPYVDRPVRMVDVNSSMMSAVGKYDPYNDWDNDSAQTNDVPKTWNWLFIQFKGTSNMYRYTNVTLAQFIEILNLERSAAPDASVGSYFSQQIKKFPDTYKCEKLNDEGQWVAVVPRVKKGG